MIADELEWSLKELERFMKEKFKFVNNSNVRAVEALNFLASNPRPSGGNEKFNSESLIMIADELEKSLKKLEIHLENS